MLPQVPSNEGLKRNSTKVPIDDKGNYINEISFEVNNNPDKPTKHLVFIHGYGASLGCFARNFQLVNLLKNLNYNYKVHFLDNISFGLSSNPKIDLPDLPFESWKIDQLPEVKMNDTDLPTDHKKLHNKYYKLIDSYQINTKEFCDYQDKYTPVLMQLEKYYTSALENWRINSNIDKIDYLFGHSFGGYWSASYAIKYPERVKSLSLFSPVGVERHVHAVTNPMDPNAGPVQTLKPELDPTSYKFLSRWPILSSKHIKEWYNYQPFLPRLLKFMGPWGVQKYYDMWYLRLFKINKIIRKESPRKVLQGENDLVYGTNTECKLIIEYLYNSISNGTNSDKYVKMLLTPSTVSRYPLYDKFVKAPKSHEHKVHVIYGQYDFMNTEAGMKLTHYINNTSDVKDRAKFYKIPEGGHNFYIDNPFETNKLVLDIVKHDD